MTPPNPSSAHGNARRGDELPIGEILIRSVYMRLYRSHTIGELYYMPDDDVIRARLLVTRGHALEVAPRMYRLTDEGITAWAEMNRKLLLGDSGQLWTERLKRYLRD